MVPLRAVATVLLLLLLSGCTWFSRPGGNDTPTAPTPPEPPPVESEQSPYAIPAEPEPQPDPGPPGVADYPLGDGLQLRAGPAQGAMPTVRRAIYLLQEEKGGWQVVDTVNLPYLPGNTVTFRTQDLPGYPGAILIEARRAGGLRHGAVAIVNGRLKALDFHRLVAPKPEITQGVFLYLNKYLNEIWVFKDASLVAMFPTANGRDPWGTQPTWQDLKTNYKTPEGLFPIKQKIVNPPYNSLGGNHPPAAGGAPNNPLGTRWIGFEVLPGDGGGIWGFHGTYVPEQIGTWASEGCVRLNTADAEKLYDLVPMGAMVRIVSGR